MLERKQKELSGSLLASYFYNCKYTSVFYTLLHHVASTGLSYCRHRSNLQKNVSHMLLTNSPYQLKEDGDVLTKETLQLLTDADGRVTYCMLML